MSTVFHYLLLKEPGDAYLVLYAAGLRQLPLVMGLLLTGLALGLKLLWPRTPTTVAMVTSMVFNSLILVVATVFALVPYPWALVLMGLWLGIHLLQGLKVAFQSDWPRTLASAFLLIVAWGILLIVATFAGGYQVMMDLASVLH